VETVRITAGLALLVVAVLLFMLSALGVSFQGLNFLALGLAFFAAAFAADRLMRTTD